MYYRQHGELLAGQGYTVTIGQNHPKDLNPMGAKQSMTVRPVFLIRWRALDSSGAPNYFPTYNLYYVWHKNPP